MLPAAIWNLVSTAHSIKDKQGLLLVNQIMSWSMLGEYANCRSTCDLMFLQQWSYHIIYHLFSFCGSVQDYKIHMDMEIVKFAQEI